MELMPEKIGNLTYICEEAYGRLSEGTIKYFCFRALQIIKKVHDAGYMHRMI